MSLSAFNDNERKTAHELLATRVAYMSGRKLEEGDWSSVYCRSKAIPERGWSNLSIDVMHQNLGVEHKMLCVRSDRSIRSYCGERLMHPSATRSIRLPETRDANEVMSVVLTQYATLLDERSKKLRENAPNDKPDLRTGWLLWQETLSEFLYFEERAVAPKPSAFYAEWKESGGGSRKASKNVWVYEKTTGHKRFSITTSAGPKIQPYFDVPPPTDPNVYTFKVQGEEIERGLVRVWLTSATARELERIIGSLSPERLSLFISNVATDQRRRDDVKVDARETAQPVLLTQESYNLLTAAFPEAISDEHRAQLLAAHLQS